MSMWKNRMSTAVCAAAIVSLCALSVEAADGPKLVVKEMLKDMGKVSQGEVLDVDFELVNEGDETLQIKAVRPTCGCTVADFDREIEAGTSGFIKAKLDTSDFSGPISKSILVMTNDPQDPSLTLVIKTDVHPFVEVLPRALVRFNAVQHEPMEQTLTVVSGDEQPDFKVTGVRSSVPFLETEVRELTGDELVAGKPAPQYRVSLSMNDEAPVGPVNAMLEVQTNHPKAKKVPVKVFGVVRALLHVTPSQVQFGEVSAKKQPGRNLILVNNRSNNVPVRVTAATVDDAAFDADVITIEEGRRYQVTITVKPGASPGNRNATLILKTSDRQFPELQVPVKANIS